MLYSIKNFIKSNTGLLIRMDDIAEHMNWKLMNKCETLFDKYNIRPLLGVIPNNQDEKLHIYEKKENFWNKVRLWQEKGWEISMHGFSHVYDTETKKKITLIMEEDQNFLVMITKRNYLELEEDWKNFKKKIFKLDLFLHQTTLMIKILLKL